MPNETEARAALLARLPAYARCYEPARDRDLRLAVLVKLFGLYPLHRDQQLEAAMLGYFEELEDVPVWALDLGCRRLVREPGRAYRPSVGELRNAAALCVAIKTEPGLGRDRKASDEPLPRRRVRLLLARGREIVGQPDPAPAGGFLSPAALRLAAGVAETHRLPGVAS